MAPVNASVAAAQCPASSPCLQSPYGAYYRLACEPSTAVAQAVFLPQYTALQLTWWVQCPPGSAATSTSPVSYLATEPNIALVAIVRRNYCLAFNATSVSGANASYVSFAVNATDASVFVSLFNDSACNQFISNQQIASANSVCAAINNPSTFSLVTQNATANSTAVYSSSGLYNPSTGAAIAVRYLTPDCASPISLEYSLSATPCTASATCSYGATTQQYLQQTCLTSLDSDSLYSFINSPKNGFNVAGVGYLVVERFYDAGCATPRSSQVFMLNACVTQESFSNGSLLSSVSAVINGTLIWTEYANSKCAGSPIQIINYGMPDGTCKPTMYIISLFYGTASTTGDGGNSLSSASSGTLGGNSAVIVGASIGAAALFSILAACAAVMYVKKNRLARTDKHFSATAVPGAGFGDKNSNFSRRGGGGTSVDLQPGTGFAGAFGGLIGGGGSSMSSSQFNGITVGRGVATDASSGSNTDFLSANTPKYAEIRILSRPSTKSEPDAPSTYPPPVPPIAAIPNYLGTPNIGNRRFESGTGF
ncbi:hypothetical protein HDU82_003408 [Entophlyctis luteolus]|nr:hypothetical protein HDU82_003408 [Entophlyctis luteolus]